jgi:hypothetical protein
MEIRHYLLTRQALGYQDFRVVSCQVKRFLPGVEELQPDRRAMMPTIPYPSDLSDCEWQILAPRLPPSKPGGRPRTVNLRVILNGIFYLLRSGCPWRLLPRDYGPWSTV